MAHAVPLDAPARDFDAAAHPARLLDPIHREPRRQAVGIAVVAECVVNAGEGELDSHVIAVVGHHARLPQLRLAQRQPVEREFVQIGVVGHLSAVQMHRQRLLVRAPHADVVAGLPAYR